MPRSASVEAIVAAGRSGGNATRQAGRMLAQALDVVVLIGNGITAGVLFCVALSVVPALASMPVDRYVEAHRLLGRNYDPAMPVIVLSSTVTDLVLAVLAGSIGTRLLFAAGAVLLLGVSTVSHLRNVPINRRVKALDASRLPAGWQDPRPRWRRWNLVRTGLALLALAVNATAVTLAA
jgi:uncharacterized membrane protein